MSYTCSSRLIDMVPSVMPEGENRQAVLRSVGPGVADDIYIVLYRVRDKVAAIGMRDKFSGGVGISIVGHPDKMPHYELVGYIEGGPQWGQQAIELINKEGGQ